MKHLTSLLFIFFFAQVNAADPVFVASADDGFSHPHDLLFNPVNNYLYVSDMQNDIIVVLNASNLQRISIIGKGQLSSPHDVALDQKGRLLVADTGNNRIVIYNISVKKPVIVGELKDGLSNPEGVTVDNLGAVYVADTGSHSLVVFKSGKRVARRGKYGKLKGQFIRPHDIEFAADNKFYIGDPGNNRIQVWSAKFEYEKSITGIGIPFHEPKYLALDKKNTLYIADQHNNVLRIVNDQGQQIAAIDVADKKMLNRPEGVEVFQNNIWVSDTYNDRILLFHWNKLNENRMQLLRSSNK